MARVQRRAAGDNALIDREHAAVNTRRQAAAARADEEVALIRAQRLLGFEAAALPEPARPEEEDDVTEESNPSVDADA